MPEFIAIDIDLSVSQWIVLCICAFVITISKTSIPGIGLFAVVLLANFFPTKASTGLLLPILAMADIFAVVYYRRHAQWKHILRLLPWAIAGICIGSVLIRYLSDVQFRPIIGITVIIIFALSFWRNRLNADNVPTHWTFAAFMGLLAGCVTQLTNAAGPIMIIYLLAMRLNKHKLIGTAAWYFLILNWLKIPIFIWEGRITGSSLVTDLCVLPVIAASAFVGVVLLKKIPQKWFNIVIQTLIVISVVKLLFF